MSDNGNGVSAPPPATVGMLVSDLYAMSRDIATARLIVHRDARMHADDKIPVFAKLKAIDARIKKYLQLSLLAPEHRELG